jgi:hypothetical protein
MQYHGKKSVYFSDAITLESENIYVEETKTYPFKGKNIQL